ncbi:hypothetical protein L7F22_024455 [Adiantum nelumboides]|nr:hypothetical protein [Adiantum nelumboides]
MEVESMRIDLFREEFSNRSACSLGIDWIDLPPVTQVEGDNLAGDDCSWLHRKQRLDHEVKCAPSLEGDKAVSKAVSDQSQQGSRFTRVFMVLGGGIDVPRTPKPKHGSPMRWIYSNSERCKKASTFKIWLTFQESKKLMQYFGTAFKLSPTISLTAGHCLHGLQEDPKVKIKLKEIHLKSKESSPTWEAYKPAMAVEIALAVRDMAGRLGVREDIILMSKDLLGEACMQVKQELLKHLVSTFGKFSSGMMLASIGCLVLEEGNNCCIGTTVSLLGGSSGAAVCPLALENYVIGVHSGGSRGFDLNIATSTDCPEFYVNYVDKVLPKLPFPDSDFWSGIDLVPFLDWLFRIRHVIPNDSPWLKAARTPCNATKKKRPRDV